MASAICVQLRKRLPATGSEAVVTSEASVLRNAERLVLPGVGAFAACMKRNFLRAVSTNWCANASLQGRRLLGVCVGMQLLFEESEEFGRTPGLGLLLGPGATVSKRSGRAARWLEPG